MICNIDARLMSFILLASACQTPTKALPTSMSSDQKVSVRVVPITRGLQIRHVVLPGVLGSKRTYDLGFKVGGVVTSVWVDEGQLVKRGQILAQIDPSEVTAVVRQAEENMAKAERDAMRLKALQAEGSVPVTAAQDALTGLEVARAGLNAAQFNAKHTVIIAPETGVVERRLVETGQVVGPGQPAFRLNGRTSGWVAHVFVSDRDLAQMGLNTTASVHVDAVPDVAWPGTVQSIASTSSPMTGLFEVEIGLKSSDAFRNGASLKVVFSQPVSQAVTIPLSAIVEGTGDTGAVYTVDQNKQTRRRTIRIGWIENNHVTVLSGLDDATHVMTHGHKNVTEGTRVAIVEER